MSVWNAVVLAGDRGLTDPVARAADVAGKAAVTFQNVALLERVVSALQESRSVESIVVVGPAERVLSNSALLASCLDDSRINCLLPANSPSASALKGMREAGNRPTLLLTCDLPLLSGELIDNFCLRMESLDADFVATAVDYNCIATFLPGIKKTVYRFKGKQVCFANLFAVLSEPGLHVIEYWQDIENSRKRPFDIIKKIDWKSLLAYKLGFLALDQVAGTLSKKTGANIMISPSDVANYALDVDSADDYLIFQDYFNRLD